MRKSEKSGRKILPGIWQLNRKTFIVRVQPKDPCTGKKRNLRRLLEDSTRQEAIRVREELLQSVHAEPGTAASGATSLVTVRTFASSWLPQKKARGDLSETTQARYVNALDRLSGEILDAPVDSVPQEAIEDWIAWAVRPDPEREPKRFANSTVNGWLRVLRALLSDAQRRYGFTVNPAASVRLLPEHQDLEDTNSLEPEDLGALLRQLRALEGADRPVGMAAWTQAFTALRWGEVSALQWDDLDENNRLLHIRRTVRKGKVVPTTKTRRARLVGVAEPLLDELKRYRGWLEEQEHPGLGSGLMFPSSAGKPIWSARVSEALREARKRAGITQRFTSHGFRRSATNLLRQAQVDPVAAKAITGHATDRMRAHYSTIRSDEARAVGDRMAALLVPSLASKSNLTVIEGGASAAKESPEESTEPSMTPETDMKKAGG